MEAVILAGGRGTRMGAMCADTPKPLLPLAGEPVIMRQIRALSAEGIRKITVVAGYLADRLISALGDGSAFGVSLRYYREETPLGTAGALGSLGLTEDFLLLSGDLLFSFSLPDMAAFHRERGALATLFAHPNAHPFGDAVVVVVRKNGEAEILSRSELTDVAFLGGAVCDPAQIEVLEAVQWRKDPPAGRFRSAFKALKSSLDPSDHYHHWW